MRTALTIFLLFLVSSIFAQTSDTPTTDSVGVAYEYCQIVGTQKLLSLKVTVRVDFGTATYAEKIKDPKTGKPMAFNTMIHALNYMGAQGWEFVQAYAITGTSSHVYHYLLRREKIIE